MTRTYKPGLDELEEARDLTLRPYDPRDGRLPGGYLRAPNRDGEWGGGHWSVPEQAGDVDPLVVIEAVQRHRWAEQWPDEAAAARVMHGRPPPPTASPTRHNAAWEAGGHKVGQARANAICITSEKRQSTPWSTPE